MQIRDDKYTKIVIFINEQNKSSRCTVGQCICNIAEKEQWTHTLRANRRNNTEEEEKIHIHDEEYERGE